MAKNIENIFNTFLSAPLKKGENFNKKKTNLFKYFFFSFLLFYKMIISKLYSKPSMTSVMNLFEIHNQNASTIIH